MKKPFNYYFKESNGGMYLITPYRIVRASSANLGLLFIFFDGEELAFNQADLSPYGHEKGVLIPVSPESAQEAQRVNEGSTLKPITEPEFFIRIKQIGYMWHQVKPHKYTPTRMFLMCEGHEFAFNRHTLSPHDHKVRDAIIYPMDAASKRDVTRHNERVKRDETIDGIKWVMRHKIADVPTAILEQVSALLEPYRRQL